MAKKNNEYPFQHAPQTIEGVSVEQIGYMDVPEMSTSVPYIKYPLTKEEPKKEEPKKDNTKK